jgi:hypothetical protein
MKGLIIRTGCRTSRATLSHALASAASMCFVPCARMPHVVVTVSARDEYSPHPIPPAYPSIHIGLAWRACATLISDVFPCVAIRVYARNKTMLAGAVDSGERARHSRPA